MPFATAHLTLLILQEGVGPGLPVQIVHTGLLPFAILRLDGATQLGRHLVSGSFVLVNINGVLQVGLVLFNIWDRIRGQDANSPRAFVLVIEKKVLNFQDKDGEKQHPTPIAWSALFDYCGSLANGARAILNANVMDMGHAETAYAFPPPERSGITLRTCMQKAPAIAQAQGLVGGNHCSKVSDG